MADGDVYSMLHFVQPNSLVPTDVLLRLCAVFALVGAGWWSVVHWSLRERSCVSSEVVSASHRPLAYLGLLHRGALLL